MEMDFGPLFELIVNFEDEELLERLRVMEKQLQPVPLTRLTTVPSYITTLQAILDRAEEDGNRSEQTLDEMRAMLQRIRLYVPADLEKTRTDFESIRQQLAERGLVEEATQAQAAIDRIAKMQKTNRVVQDELIDLDDLYSTLLSPLLFNRRQEI